MSTSGDDTFLLVRVRGSLCALPLAHVHEVSRVLPMRPVPGAPAFMSGVTVLRGHAVPVIDSAAILGHADAKADADAGRPNARSASRLVTVKLAGRRVALAVDETVGVRDLPADTRVDLPPLLRDVPAHVVSELRLLDGELLLVLGTMRLVPDDLWASFDGTGPRP